MTGCERGAPDEVRDSSTARPSQVIPVREKNPMELQVIGPDSPFVVALVKGGESRRNLVVQGHVAAARSDALMGDPHQLAQLVNVCFWASLAAEEGRPVRGTTTICSPEQVSSALRLDPPVPLATEPLVSLLTVARTAALAVHAGPQGTEIWGLVDRAYAPIDSPLLRIGGAGTVIASMGRSLGGRVLAILNGGQVAVPKLASPESWMDLVANAFGKERSSIERLKLAGRLLHIVVRMHSHGHGGTLVVTPPGSNSLQTQVRFKYRLDEAGQRFLRDQIAQAEEAAHEAIKGEEAFMLGHTPEVLLPHLGMKFEGRRLSSALLDGALRKVADLSRIDGAVILDEHLSVLGFGAKLEAEHAEFSVAEVDVVSGTLRKDVFYTGVGGTRHQSAARFVFRNQDSLCFVASQDGRLSLFGWMIQEGVVGWIRGLEHCAWEAEGQA